MWAKILCSSAIVWLSAEFVGAAVARGSKVPVVIMVAIVAGFCAFVAFALWS
jgi:hypothetical protein